MSTLAPLPLPQLIAATEDSVVESHGLHRTEAKPEVDDIPSFKVPCSQGHTVSICFVVSTSLWTSPTQGTNQRCIRFDQIISIGTFIFWDNQYENSASESRLECLIRAFYEGCDRCPWDAFIHYNLKTKYLRSDIPSSKQVHSGLPACWRRSSSNSWPAAIAWGAIYTRNGWCLIRFRAVYVHADCGIWTNPPSIGYIPFCVYARVIPYFVDCRRYAMPGVPVFRFIARLVWRSPDALR